MAHVPYASDYSRQAVYELGILMHIHLPVSNIETHSLYRILHPYNGLSGVEAEVYGPRLRGDACGVCPMEIFAQFVGTEQGNQRYRHNGETTPKRDL